MALARRCLPCRPRPSGRPARTSASWEARMTDPITETDIHAFIDGQLDVARRIEVEDYLARHPEVAARVMADMRARDALALAFGGGPAPRPPERVMDAARRLERGLVWRRIGLRLQRTAAVAFLVGAGWFAHAQIRLFEIADSEASPKPPAFVEDARHSHETTLIRAGLDGVDAPRRPLRARVGSNTSTLARRGRRGASTPSSASSAWA